MGRLITTSALTSSSEIFRNFTLFPVGKSTRTIFVPSNGVHRTPLDSQTSWIPHLLNARLVTFEEKVLEDSATTISSLTMPYSTNQSIIAATTSGWVVITASGGLGMS